MGNRSKGAADDCCTGLSWPSMKAKIYRWVTFGLGERVGSISSLPRAS